MSDYLPPEHTPTREQIEGTPGPVLLEFGTRWCGHCRALESQVTTFLSRNPGITHIKVEDGPGQPLGRAFRVKVWPNLVFLRDGRVVRQLARPSLPELRDAFTALMAPA